MLVASLPTASRLALAYAPAKARLQTLALLKNTFGEITTIKPLQFALANTLEQEAETASHLGRQWAAADLAMRLGHSQERSAATALVAEGKDRRPRVSRSLRPLLVLHGLAHRRLEKGDEAAALSPAAMLKAMRLGFLGF